MVLSSICLIHPDSGSFIVWDVELRSISFIGLIGDMINSFYLPSVLVTKVSSVKRNVFEQSEHKLIRKTADSFGFFDKIPKI